MEANIPMKMSISGDCKHVDSLGRLISYSSTRMGPSAYILSDWDEWRVRYCETHRNEALSEDFREGKLTLSTIYKSIILGYKGGN